MWTFTAFFIMAQIWKQRRCLSCNEQIMLYPYNGVLLSSISERTSDLGNNINESLKHPKWKSSDLKTIHCMILFLWNSRKRKVTCQEPASKGSEWLQTNRHMRGTGEIALYHDGGGGGYKTGYICQNSQNCTRQKWQISLSVKLTPPTKLQKKKKREWQNKGEQLSPE